MTNIPAYGGIPAIGFGTFQRKGDEARRTVARALEVGYRHIDTAAVYENEVEVGEAIATSGIQRHDLFITTKIPHKNLGAGEVLASAEASLERLGLDHVDLLLIHWPSHGDAEPLPRYMTELATVKEAGLTRMIGVSNFTIRHIDEAVETLGFGAIATNQVELNVTFQNRPIVERCHDHGIPLTAYLPLDKGRIAGQPDIDRIAKRHDATPAQVAIAWLLARGHIAIPSSTNDDRIKENFDALNVSLTGGDLIDLDRLDTGKRAVNPDWAPDWDDYTV
jgi:2,5-diketo-D-gluconate reductase B